MIIRAPFTRNKEVEGVKQTHENGNLFFTVEAAANYLHYLMSPKSENDEIISPETRVKHIYTSLKIPMPAEYMNIENYDDKEVWKAAYYAAEKLKSIHDERMNLLIASGRIKREDADSIPFLQEFIFSFTNEEVEPFGSEKNIANFMIDLGKDFIERYTGFDVDTHGGFLKPHIKKNKKKTSELLPDMHTLLQTINVYGELLPLDIKEINKKIGDIHYAMEQDPKYPTLLKVRTDAWNKNGKLEKLSVKEDLAEKINEVFEQGGFNKNFIENALKDYGITIIPEHKGNQVNTYTIRYLGKVFTPAGIEEIKGMKTKIFNYIKMCDFQKANPMFNEKHFDKLREILDSNKGKPIEDLQQDLMKYGIALVPNISKTNTISGYSFKFDKIEKPLQAAVLNFRPFDYTITTMSGDKLVKAARVYLSSKEKADFDYVGCPIQSYTEDGVVYVRDAFGNFKPVIRDKKRYVYVHWSAQYEEDLFAFIIRMNKENQKSPLLQLMVSEDNKNVFYSKFNGRRSIEILDNDRIRIYQPKNRFVIESAIDAYLATHQLTDQEKEEGCVLTIRIETKNQASYDLMWLEARKKGIYVVNGEPSPEVAKKFQELCDQKANLYRSQNKKRLLTLKRNVDNKKSYKTLRLTNYKRLGNDVDRKSYAYAFVDAFLMGLDTKYVLNPPQKKVQVGARMRLDEIKQFEKEMIELVKKEAPEKLNDFYAELAKYSDETPNSNVELLKKTEKQIKEENDKKQQNAITDTSKVEDENKVKFKNPKL